MAIFKPQVTGEDFWNNGERKVFQALSKLSDEYVISCAYEWLTNKPLQKKKAIGEIDFLVMHPYKGMMVIEVKDGLIELDKNGNWVQHNHKTGTQKIIDPFEQARESSYELKSRFEGTPYRSPFIYYCVWFVRFDKRQIKGQSYPAGISEELLLDVHSLESPEKALDQAYEWWSQSIREKSIREFRYRDGEEKRKYQADFQNSVNKVILPNLRFAPCLKSITDDREERFINLTEYQAEVLETLKFNKVALFEGIAGGGKTIMAVLKAKKLAAKGESVLLLCYNRELKEDLQASTREYENIRVHNVFTLAEELTGKNYVGRDLAEFYNYLDSHGSKNWPYKNVIIDEGQDFDDELLDSLYLFANHMEGYFYLFYDSNQKIHFNDFGDWIKGIGENRYILDKNYRNTNQIFRTVCSCIDKKEELIANSKGIDSSKPWISYYQDHQSFLNKLNKFAEHVLEDAEIEPEEFVILTSSSLNESILTEDHRILGKYRISDKREKGKVFFTTIRKFKGLEAKAVMIIDLNVRFFEEEEEKNLLYVACSRARHLLHLAVEEFEEISGKVKSSIKGDFELAEYKN